MNEIFIMFLSLSLSGSILATALMLLKPALKNRLSKTWQYYIYLIIALRMLIPFTPDVSIVGDLFNHADNYLTEQNISDGIISHNTLTDNNGQNEITELPTEAEISSNIDNNTVTAGAITKHFDVFKNNLWIIWITTAVMLFVRKITVYHSFIQFMKAGCHEVENVGLIQEYQEICAVRKIRNPLAVYRNEIAAAPMLVGIFRPFIVLPDIDIKKKDLRYVLIHELTHYKRLDIFYKWLVQIIVCLHWFNPLVYRISKEVNCYCELSCDEYIIKQLDKEERFSYGDTLLAAIKPNSGYSNSIVAITLNENTALIKERLEAIMKYKGKSVKIFFASIIFTCILLCGAVFTGSYAIGNGQNNQFISEKNVTDNYNISSSIKSYTTEEADKRGEQHEVKKADSAEADNIHSEEWKTASYKMLEFNIPTDWSVFIDEDNGVLSILNENDKAIGGFIIYKKGEKPGISNDTLDNLYNSLTNYGKNKDTSNSLIKIGSYDAMVVYTVSTLENQKDGKVLRYIFIDLSDIDSTLICTTVYFESEKAVYEDTVTKIWESFSIAE